MIADWIAANTGWAWLAGGLALLLMELAVPGVFLFWVGLAAAAVGAIVLFGLDAMGWQSQAFVFAALSVLFVVIGQRLARRRGGDADAAEPFNRPGRHMVGRAGALAEPIDGGIGRMRLGETVWRVEGPDLPAGARVRVVAADGGTLRVEPEPTT